MSNKWSWVEGEIDTGSDHIELRYGSVESGGWDDWLPVARIASPQDNVFRVEFLLTADKQPAGVIDAVKDDLNYYLVDKGEVDPWAYARYHCTTTANVYADVHWSYVAV